MQQAALFAAGGLVVANVPHPSRYALHRLLVFAEPGATRRVTANRDLAQSAALLSFHRTSSAWEVEAAWKDLPARGPGWRERALRGREALAAIAPELDVTKWLASRSAPPKKRAKAQRKR